MGPNLYEGSGMEMQGKGEQAVQVMKDLTVSCLEQLNHLANR